MQQFQLAPFALPGEYGEGIVPLVDVKEHLGVLEDDFDALLGVLRDAAIDMVERYCGVRLGLCEGLEWHAERLPDPVQLGVWPVSAVTGVTWLDSAGAEVDGDPAIFRRGVRDMLRLVPGQSLPGGVAGGVVITFTAGFDDTTRPPALVSAVKMFTAHLFANREAVSGGVISGEVPLGFRAMCNAYRMPVI